MSSPVIATIGRRKCATARVRLTPGSGKMTVNDRPLEEYCYFETLSSLATSPIETVEATGQFDIVARVNGGGPNGQAGALRLGIARALEKHNAEWRSALKAAGHLKRDPRERERKKPGQPGARKRFQFSKR